MLQLRLAGALLHAISMDRNPWHGGWGQTAAPAAVLGCPWLPGSGSPCLVLALPIWFWLSLPGSGAPCLLLALPVWFWCSLPGSGAPCSIPMPSRQLPGRQCLCTHRRAHLWGSFQWLPLCCSSPWGFREGSLGAACASWPGLCVTPSAALEGWTRCQTCLAIDITQDTFSAGTLLRGYERCSLVQQRCAAVVVGLLRVKMDFILMIFENVSRSG